MTKSTFHRPPSGARDLLPLDVAQKQWVEKHLRQTFRQWGYRRIITPTLERLDTLVAGGAVDPDTVLQLRDSEGTTLGLRPELTASIARAAATRMAGAALPLRLYYNTNVFRNTRHEKEFFQAGVELIGAPGWLADAEVILLLADCLRALNLDNWTLILGEVSLTQSLLGAISPSAQPLVQRAILELDRVGLETAEIPERDRQAALQVLDLRGQPQQVFAQLQGMSLPSQQRRRVRDLERLCGVLTQQEVPLVLDLSLLEGYRYYTGMMFEAVSGTEQLGLGGRYDSLFGLYSPAGEQQAGIGFSLTLEALQRVLQSTGQLPDGLTAPQTLLVPLDAAAVPAVLRLAAEWRSQSPEHSIEIELLGEFATARGNRTPEEIAAYARTCGIAEITWVQADGSHHSTTTHLSAVTRLQEALS
ncbi:ATP phosphoribosyltransferase regulatory subunit [Synechococcus sp. PCC 7336]|uniref:ATP phosphoribosyltransferase regulatory subunit n=1 Tax=Synechococcus sp. PCC 7336 TaxID=195250 RepID=UPI000684A811|nr:ATP phosphoribosyltransferase regulatory subunit [Synechococcus sp. PCC 7336]